MTQAILCVDDEDTILDCLKEQVRRRFGQDFLCETANSGEEALEVIDELMEEDVRLLVIVSDWLMPGLRGDEFLVRVHRKYPEIVTIMLTGQADRTAIDRAQQEANLHCCLQKPWTEEELYQTIQTGLALL
ncbi:MAG: response regulator [Synechococcales bacterium]|nr:response regulator [Synechococcales bacterium]